MTATSLRVPGNLPETAPGFVGRKRELTTAKQLLRSARLVTLTGVGGVGKSTLALHLAQDVHRSYPGGAWMVGLGELQAPSLVPHTVAATLGLREQPGRSPVERLVAYVGRRRMLLVLDDCEHVVAEVAGLAHLLLRACPALRILATSREPLGTYGETTLPVPTMPVPDPARAHTTAELARHESVALFLQRGVEAAPGFTLTGENREAVTTICHRLDGVPLALELVAARLRAMTAPEIAQQLAFRVLPDPGPDAAARRRTLRSCIQWSHDLCTPQEQMLWHRLSVFTGGVELDAAEAVCAGDGLEQADVLDLTAGLVAKSILVREDRDRVARYRLLQSTGEFGQERLLEAGEHATWSRRHRDWCETLARRAEDEWLSPRQTEFVARLAREHANLRAALELSLGTPGEAASALRMSADLYVFWFVRGLLSEGRHWLGRALAAMPAPTLDRLRAVFADCVLACNQGDLAAASAREAEARTLAARLDDPFATALTTYAAGVVAGYRRDIPAAVELVRHALDAFREQGDVLMQVRALTSLAVASGMRGDEQAVVYHKAVLELTEPRGDVWYRSLSLWALALSAYRQGDIARANELAGESLRLKQQTNDPLGCAWCFELLAWIADDQHRADRAAMLLGAVAGLSELVGTPAATFADLAATHRACEQHARSALGDRVYDEAFRQGKSLPFEEVITFALDDPGPPAGWAPATR